MKVELSAPRFGRYLTERLAKVYASSIDQNINRAKLAYNCPAALKREFWIRKIGRISLHADTL